MLLNYFKTAWRNLLRNKVYSLLLILGLATGMAVALLIGLWVYEQYSYDRFLPGYTQAYQVRYNYNHNGQVETRSEVCIPLAAALKNDIPEIAHVAMGFGSGGGTLRVGDKLLSLNNVIGGKDPINQYIHWSLSNAPNRLRIIGVVKDALTNAPFAAAEPTIFVYQPTWSYAVELRLAPNVSTQTALATVRTIFDRYNSGASFDYHFEDENFATKFELEMLVGRLAGIFAAFAIFISCLGLFGLAAYVAEQRTKEIGIRKVLGASVPQIFVMLTRDFIVLVSISCVMATPIAFYFLQNWLDRYSYRITIHPVVFVIAAAAAIVITVVTISFQAIKAAVMNPAKSLKAD